MTNQVVSDVQNANSKNSQSATAPNQAPKKIAVIPGDGIGPEVVAEAVKVLKAATSEDQFEFTHYSLGANHWLETQEVLNDDTLAELATKDAIILGAVGAAPGSTQIPSGLLERGLLLKLRFAFEQDVNLRPSKIYPGAKTPLADYITADKKVDFVVVREGTEGLYAGNGGSMRTGTVDEIATEVSVNTAMGVERVVRYAFELASTRRNQLTLLHKHNVLVHAGGLWNRIFNQISAEYPEVTTSYLHIDAATIKLVTNPDMFDVIVTDNLFGDIITDEAAAVTGGIGLAPSANICTSRKFPSMFEPVHGSAPDIAGQNIADPIAAISSMVLLLNHLGMPQQAALVEKAVEDHLAMRGTDQLATDAIGDDVANRVLAAK